MELFPSLGASANGISPPIVLARKTDSSFAAKRVTGDAPRASTISVLPGSSLTASICCTGFEQPANAISAGKNMSRLIMMLSLSLN
jgi:hypothetical protein